MQKRKSVILKYLQIFCYLAFLFLWFKDNFLLFRSINLSYLIPLIPFIIITVIRCSQKILHKKIKLRVKCDKVFFALIALLIIAAAIRIPFYFYNFGLVDSDDFIPILAGKHISEGQLPPVYCYGEQYEGTFTHHIYALMFKIFGYSVLVVLLVSLFFYLAFIFIQFLFFKEISSSTNLSLILCSFYCLPIGYLLALSFHATYPPFVFLLGSISMYFSFLVYKKNREDLIPFLGFFWGLLFWTHPMAIYFIVCSFFLIVLKYQFFLRKYLRLITYSFVGGFPVILFQIGHSFETFKYLFSGTKIQGMPLDKIKAFVSNIIYLVSGEKNFLNYIYAFFIFMGIITIIYFSFKRRKFLPENIFVIFFIVILAVSTFSRFVADELLIRYLYPLYFVLPFFLVSIFNFFKRKIKYALMLALFLIIVVFNNLKPTYANYILVKKTHHNLKNILSAMEMTGEKYWAGDYWQVNLLTGLSEEERIGWSYTHEKYFPYRLWYFNHGENNNYVFFKETGSYALKFKESLPHIAGVLERFFNQADDLIDLLESLDVKAKKEKIGDYCWLIYDISSPVFPLAFNVPLPQKIPKLEPVKIESSGGYLLISFENKAVSEYSGFRLHLEIPGYSSFVGGFPSGKEVIKRRIPFPKRESFKIRHFLDYKGIRIPSTSHEISYSPLAEELLGKKQKIVYLSGFGPFVEIYGGKRRICEKEINFEINELLNEESKIRFDLYSPFVFSHPFWYGDYSQMVRIEINGRYLTERRIEDGENVIEVDLKEAEIHKNRNLIKLKFKYHLPFKFKPLWKTATLLNKIEIR